MCNLSRAEKIVCFIVVVSQVDQYLPIIKYESLIAKIVIKQTVYRQIINENHAVESYRSNDNVAVESYSSKDNVAVESYSSNDNVAVENYRSNDNVESLSS